MRVCNRILLATIVSCILGCGDDSHSRSNVEVLCDCASGGTSIIVAANLTVTAITLSGDACDASQLSCSVQTDSSGVTTCVSGAYFIHSTRVGTCHVEIDLDGRAPVIRDLDFEHASGCCDGIYPVAGDGLVNVDAS
jgi:hypothetical protein